MKKVLSVVCAVSMSMVLLGTTYAQRDAGAKARGDFFFYARSGHSHMSAAHAHASHYHSYLSQAKTVSPQIAQLTHATVTHHLDLAEKHSAAMREHLATEKNTEATEMLNNVDKHLSSAREHYKNALSVVKEPPAEPKKVQVHITKMQNALQKAIDQHEKLQSTYGSADPNENKK